MSRHYEDGAPDENDIIAATEKRSTTKMFKFSSKFNRPYLEGEGPADANNSHNYNQKFKNFIQDELDHCKVDHKNHGMEAVAENIEKYFKASLIRRFD